MAAGPLVVHRSVELAPEPASVPRARAVVFEALQAARLDQDRIDTAVLLVSELVTNAVVHARTDIGVTVTVTGGSLRVEVSDRSPHLPSRRTYDEDATTGRGLELLELLADATGVDSFADDGKLAWFVLGDEATPAPESAEPAAPARQSQQHVRLLAVPVELYCIWQQHSETLLREMLLAAFDPDLPASAEHLQELGIANDALSVLAAASGEAFERASSEDERIDLLLSLDSGSVAASFAVLSEVLELGNELAASGKLLAPADQPEIARVRAWCCREVLRQAAGLQPAAWRPDFPHSEATLQPPPDWDGRDVTGSTEAVVAADDSNRIIAVSAAAAELLGWSASELLGQRIVTIIPPRLRERHIAGFLRYLLTGRGRIIGQPTAVSALHRNGRELPVTLTLTTHPAKDGRTVFTAFLAPRNAAG